MYYSTHTVWTVRHGTVDDTLLAAIKDLSKNISDKLYNHDIRHPNWTEFNISGKLMVFGQVVLTSDVCGNQYERVVMYSSTESYVEEYGEKPLEIEYNIVFKAVGRKSSKQAIAVSTRVQGYIADISLENSSANYHASYSACTDEWHPYNFIDDISCFIAGATMAQVIPIFVQNTIGNGAQR